MSLPSSAFARSVAQMGSRSTLAASVRARILSDYSCANTPSGKTPEQGRTRTASILRLVSRRGGWGCGVTDGDFEVVIGKDESGIGSGEL